MMNGLFFHDSHDSFYRYPFGAVECGQKITIRLKSLDSTLQIDSAILRLWKYESFEEKVLMEKAQCSGGQSVYQCSITAPEKPGLLWYYFIIQCNGRTYYYGNNPENLGGIGSTYDYQPGLYQVTVYKKGFTTPSWFKDSIMYQIMVDRFYNGNDDGTVNDPPKGSVIHKDWYETPNYMPDPKTAEFLCNDFFGGNLKGIIKKLPYLRDLGINIIYLNPIFQSASNHKYNTGDYMKIDPMYGNDDIFKELIHEAKNSGISIILDGVFSHTGSDSVYFNKDGNYDSTGAYQSKSSPYYKWYRFINYPDDYECWWGIKTLPNVDETEPSYQDFIFGNSGSVVDKWMGFGIAGWRLDVADELPDEFLKKFSKAVKTMNRDGVVIGEVWEDASNKISYGKFRQYLLGDELDGVMNYRLMDALLGFLTEKQSGEHLNRVVMSLYENYPLHCFYSIMNILGTHDTCRVKYVFGGIDCDGGGYSREQQASLSLTPEQEEKAIKKLYLASLFQMTFPGVPSIYYGDEAGLGGCRDPFNRKTYPWGRENCSLIEWYRKICALRHRIDTLRTGAFHPVHYGNDTYGFLRIIDGDTDVFGQKRNRGIALILLNRSSEKHHRLILDLRKWGINEFYDVLGNKGKFECCGGVLSIDLSPLEGLVLCDGSTKEKICSDMGD